MKSGKKDENFLLLCISLPVILDFLSGNVFCLFLLTFSVHVTP